MSILIIFHKEICGAFENETCGFLIIQSPNFETEGFIINYFSKILPFCQNERHGHT